MGTQLDLFHRQKHLKRMEFLKCHAIPQAKANNNKEEAKKLEKELKQLRGLIK